MEKKKTDKPDKTETEARVSRGETGGAGKVIYLACPYSHRDRYVEMYRARLATKCATQLILRGYMVYSPLTYGREIIAHALMYNRRMIPGDWLAWRELDSRIIRVCDEVYVLNLLGWRESVGVAAEIELARKLGKPVWLVKEDGTILSCAVDQVGGREDPA